MTTQATHSKLPKTAQIAELANQSDKRMFARRQDDRLALQMQA